MSNLNKSDICNVFNTLSKFKHTITKGYEFSIISCIGSKALFRKKDGKYICRVVDENGKLQFLIKENNTHQFFFEKIIPILEKKESLSSLLEFLDYSRK